MAKKKIDNQIKNIEKEEEREKNEFRIAEWKRNQKLRQEYEKEKQDLAPWIGWEEYRDARKSEVRIKAIGIIGAFMRGEKRRDVREKYKISSDKLNKILNSEIVEDIIAYSLGFIYSFQTAAMKAIQWQLENEKNGHLAVDIFDRLGLFDRMKKLMTKMEGIKTSEDYQARDIIGFLFARGKNVQAGHNAEALSQLIVQALKSQPIE